MPYVYIDESENVEAGYYFVGALIASASQTKKLVTALNELGVDVSKRFDVDPRAEFHGNPLTQGTDDWIALKGMARARLGIFREVIEIICDHDLQFLVRGVNTKRLADRDYPVKFPPHEICLEHVIQRLEPDLKNDKRYAMLIADEHQSAGSLRGQLRRWERNGTRAAYMHTIPERLLDTIHFTPSVESRMLQAADILTYFYQRYICVPATDPRAKAYMEEVWEIYKEILHPKFGFWTP